MEQEMTQNERFARICMNAKNVMNYVDKNGYTPNEKSEMAKMLESGTYKPTYTNEAIKKSKLPKEILESMISNPINVGDEFNINLDNVIKEDTIQKVNKATSNKSSENVTESTFSQPNGSVDYSIIRMIVEDTVKKYTSSIKKSLLKESTSTTNEIKAMRMGKKLQFITENGDLYEAELKFIRNLKK